MYKLNLLDHFDNKQIRAFIPIERQKGVGEKRIANFFTTTIIEEQISVYVGTRANI